jgi:hypothetical protein
MSVPCESPKPWPLLLSMSSPMLRYLKRSSESSNTLSSAESSKPNYHIRPSCPDAVFSSSAIERTEPLHGNLPEPKATMVLELLELPDLFHTASKRRLFDPGNFFCICSSVIWSYKDGIVRSGTSPSGHRWELQRGS